MDFLFYSISLGKLFGTEIKLHFSFLILLLFIIFLQPLSSTIILLLLFSSVLAHEYGHIFAAKYFKIPTRYIILTPIGGLANISQIPKDSKKEFLITIAGPSVNLIISSSLFIILLLWTTIPKPIFTILGSVMLLNVTMMIFNLIPSFPMDGGRILRSILFTKYDYYMATKMAVNVSKFFLICYFITGLIYGHFPLILIAIFMWIAGQTELKSIRNY